MVSMKQLSSEGKIAYLIKPILKVLQEAGGQLKRSEIKARIADLDDQIAEFAEIEKKSKKTGNTYKDFNFKFNFAIKDLFFVGLLTYTDTSPVSISKSFHPIDQVHDNSHRHTNIPYDNLLFPLYSLHKHLVM